MKVYLFEAAPLCLTFTPTTKDGTPIGDALDEQSPEETDTAVVRLMRNHMASHLADRLSVGEQQYIVLRTSAARLLVQQLRFPSDLISIPTTVASTTGNQVVSEDYLLLFSRQEFDVLDRDHAKYIAVNNERNEEVIVSVRKWSILSAALPALDAFPAKPNDWLVTEPVKQLFEAHNWTGGQFKEALVY